MSKTPTPVIPNNVRALRLARGLTQRELAERSKMHLTNLNRIEKNHIQLTGWSAMSIAQALDVPLEEVLIPQRSVQLVGDIGAGGEVYAVEGSSAEEVAAPPSSSDDTVAGRVTGLSMLPVYEDGTLIYWSKLLPPDAMVNRRCVAQLADGRIMVKVLKKGSTKGLWTLVSINPAYPDIEDVAVDWVSAIEWVRPTA